MLPAAGSEDLRLKLATLRNLAIQRRHLVLCIHDKAHDLISFSMIAAQKETNAANRLDDNDLQFTHCVHELRVTSSVPIIDIDRDCFRL